MSSWIPCKLEIKNLEMLKKVLDMMHLTYQENTVNEQLIARGYGNASSKVDLLVPQSELRKIQAGSYGDMGFVYNKNTETYDVMLDSVDRRVANTMNQIYAVESIKDFAIANKRSYTISTEEYGSQEIVIEVY